MNKEYLTITELNNYIKNMFEQDSTLFNVYLKGEVSNLKKHSTGHWYFSLKDESSRISAVMFKFDASKVDFLVEDGMNVLVTGRISVYPRDGSYQIYVNKLEQDGLGKLHIEFEKLKEKLSKEGLFDKKHKKLIPKYAEKTGVITAPTGAAIKDIISTIKRRNKLAEVILFPCLVQGENAKYDIVEKLKIADTYNLDLIILGRGGGSLEDLWAFNEEVVAREIFKINTPIISAVGHEIDYTISDFVADLRAETPTAAAEVASFSALDLTNEINHYKIRLNKFIKNTVNLKYIALRNIKENYILKNPLSMYEVNIQKVDSLIEKVNKEVIKIVQDKTNDLHKIKSSFIFKKPHDILKIYSQSLDLLINSIKNLNPLDVLNRGYSIVSDNSGIIKDVKSLKVKDIINIKLLKGEIKAEVKEIK